MFGHVELAYVVVQVPDPGPLGAFLTDVVGLRATETGFSNDDATHRVIVERGAANDVVAVGLDVGDDDTRRRVMSSLAAIGIDHRDGDEETRAARRVEQIGVVDAPWGIGIELVTGLDSDRGPVELPKVPGGFVTAGVGFGHVVFGTTDLPTSHRFLVDGLGFAQSDWIEMDLGGVAIEVRFYHCNERHHTIAVAGAPFELPQRLHHMMFETCQFDDTGAAFDRALAAGHPIPNSIGRHDNDEMISFYVTSPAGFLVEVGHGARVVGPTWDDNRRYDRMSRWGHQAVAS